MVAGIFEKSKRLGRIFFVVGILRTPNFQARPSAADENRGMGRKGRAVSTTRAWKRGKYAGTRRRDKLPRRRQMRLFAFHQLYISAPVLRPVPSRRLRDRLPNSSQRFRSTCWVLWNSGPPSVRVNEESVIYIFI